MLKELSLRTQDALTRLYLEDIIVKEALRMCENRASSDLPELLISTARLADPFTQAGHCYNTVYEKIEKAIRSKFDLRNDGGWSWATPCDDREVCDTGLIGLANVMAEDLLNDKQAEIAAARDVLVAMSDFQKVLSEFRGLVNPAISRAYDLFYGTKK